VFYSILFEDAGNHKPEIQKEVVKQPTVAGREV
jgi:hypothetical protein